jgi:hypothetical protein
MKVNYKEGDDIIIIKPGNFHGLTGKVLTHHPGTEFKPLSVDLNPYGTWQFNYEDVRPTKPEKEPVEKFPFDQPGKPAKAVKKAIPKKVVNNKKPKIKTKANERNNTKGN